MSINLKQSATISPVLFYCTLPFYENEPGEEAREWNIPSAIPVGQLIIKPPGNLQGGSCRSPVKAGWSRTSILRLLPSSGGEGPWLFPVAVTLEGWWFKDTPDVIRSPRATKKANKAEWLVSKLLAQHSSQKDLATPEAFGIFFVL